MAITPQKPFSVFEPRRVFDTPDSCPVMAGGHPGILRKGGPPTALETMTDRHPVPQQEPLLHNRPPEVEKAPLHAGVFIRIGLVLDLQRGKLRGLQNHEGVLAVARGVDLYLHDFSR